MNSSNQCPSCGSTNIYRESATVYRCSDCFDKLPVASFINSPPPKVYGTNKNTDQSPLTKYKYILIAVVVGWMALGSIFTTVYQSNMLTTTTSEDENKIIAIDPNANPSEFTPEGVFAYTNAFPDSIGNSYFLGIFTNTSGKAILMPKFTVTLFSEDGTSLGASDGYGEKNLVDNGETVSFEVLWSEIPKYHHYEIQVLATSYVGEMDRPNLSLKSINLKKDKQKGVLLTGKIQNLGTTTVNYTRVKCLLIGQNNKTIDYATFILEKENFLPKEIQPVFMEFSRTTDLPNSYYCETDGINQETGSN